MRRKALAAFGTAQRPVAWVVLAGGLVLFVAVLLNIIATGDAKLATLLGAVLVINDGFQSVAEVENELEEGGEAA